MRRLHLDICLIFLLTTGISACGRARTVDRGSVKGIVTWNGEPVEEGTIAFILPGDGKNSTGSWVTAPISVGKYQLDAAKGPSVGANKVQITAIRKTGETVEVSARPTDNDGPVTEKAPTKSVEVREQFLPKQFNENSTLNASVQAGENKFDFNLTGEALSVTPAAQ